MLTNEENVKLIDAAGSFVKITYIVAATCICRAKVKLNPFFKVLAVAALFDRLPVVDEAMTNLRKKYEKPKSKNYEEFKRRSVNLSSGETDKVVSRIGF